MKSVLKGDNPQKPSELLSAGREVDRSVQGLSTIVYVLISRLRAAKQESSAESVGGQDAHTDHLKELLDLHKVLRKILLFRLYPRYWMALYPAILGAATIGMAYVFRIVYKVIAAVGGVSDEIPLVYRAGIEIAQGPGLCALLGTTIALLISFFFAALISRWTDRSPTDLDDVFESLVRWLVLLGGPVIAFFTAAAQITKVQREFLSSALRDLTAHRVYLLCLLASATYVSVVVVNRILVVRLGRLATNTQRTFDDAFVVLLRWYGSFAVVAAGGGLAIFIFRKELAGATDSQNLLVPYAIIVTIVAGVIGFITQEATTNFFSGIIMQVDQPFSVGDRIKLETGELCYVSEIGVRATRLVDVFENNELMVPNKTLSAATVVNLTRPTSQLRMALTVWVQPKYTTETRKHLTLTALNFAQVVDPSRQRITELVENLISRFPVELAAARDKFLKSTCSYTDVLRELENKLAQGNLINDDLSARLTKEHHQLLTFFFGITAPEAPESASPARNRRAESFRYSEAARRLYEELAIAPTIDVGFELTENGDVLARVRVFYYAEHFERREQISQEFHERVVAALHSSSIPFGL